MYSKTCTAEYFSVLFIVARNTTAFKDTAKKGTFLQNLCGAASI